MSKKTHPSMVKKKRATVVETTAYGFKDIPIPPAVIEKWITELREYPNRVPTPRHMQDFTRNLGYSQKSFYEKMKDYPSLAEQYRITKEAIGYKLWEDCVDKGKNWAAAKFLIHDYGKTFAEAKEKEQAADNKPAQTIVVVPAIPEPKKGDE